MTLGFIGVGKIASAVIEALCTSTISNLHINISPRNENKSKLLESKFANVKRMASNQSVLDNSEIIFIALRPNDAQNVLTNIKFNKEHIIISLIPYLPIAKFAEAVQPATKLSRAIPLPTVINHNCPIPIFNGNETAVNIFKYIGQPLLVDEEKHFHALWALTGLISPFYDQMEKLSNWAQLKGVDKNIANRYVADMFQSLLYAAQKKHIIDFSELAAHAATPKGMNEQAAKEISEKGAHAAYTIALDNLIKKFE